MTPILKDSPVAGDFYDPKQTHAPSQNMLDDVGLDFDGDLGGLRKGRGRQSNRWMAGAAVILVVILWIAMLAANVAFGCGFMAGLIYGALGCMVWEAIE